MKSVTLRQLRAFAAVAQRSNFARAAHDLHLTPPAVTMQIKELEREVGLPLFDRAAKQIQLTLTGEYLLTYVRRMLAELKNADDMFTFYGPQSPGNSFLHPREMDPSGPYAGKLASTLMSLSGTQEGGALMLIDSANYSENDAPARPGLAAGGGQRQFTQQLLSDGRGFSEFGRVTAPYPLWDGTNRVLTSYRPCEVTRTVPGNAPVVVSCATLTQAEISALGDQDRMRGAPAVVGGVQLQDNVPASYAVYMFDPALKTFQIVAAPPAGFMRQHIFDLDILGKTESTKNLEWTGGVSFYF